MTWQATEVTDPSAFPAATYWPAIPADKTASEWRELRAWVEQLQKRFPHLDHHVIPQCWWRHNEHVEALVALRDHERISYLPVAPATAPVEWMRALRDISALLRAWAAEYACGASHQEPQGTLRPDSWEGWQDFIADDVKRRGRGTSETKSSAAG